MTRAGRCVLLTLAIATRTASAQVPAPLAAERAAFAQWLVQARTSPLAAVSATPVDARGTQVDLGGNTVRLSERDGAVWLDGAGAPRPLARYRPMSLGRYAGLVTGDVGHATLMLYSLQPARRYSPEYYPYDPALVFTGTITPAAVPHSERVLAFDGVEVEATEAGTVSINVGHVTRLRVLRLPDPGSEESSLEIYFRDGTSGAGSYPAGRFVALEPLGSGRYRLDFNRARNPFCAYNSAYPCPVPWRGNTVAAAVVAGERYPAH
jgi:uncharacterized protein